MRFRIRFSNQIVGLFVVTALVLVAAFIVALGINQRWFEQKHEYYSEFTTARGLTPGLAVSFRGFQIGQVRSVALTEDDTVRVTLSISDRHIDRITEHSVLQLQTNPLGIGGGLLLHRGRVDGEPLPPESLIPAWGSPRGVALRQAGLVETAAEGDIINELLEELPVILANVNHATTTGTQLLEQLQQMVAADATGPVPDLIRNADQMTVELRSLLALTGSLAENLRPLTEELRRPEGAVVRLVGPELDEALEKINRTLGHIEELSGFAAGSTPQIRALLYESRDALETGHAVLHGIRNNPLIRGGIQPRETPATGFEGYRPEEF